jgi:hypothetical protein
MSGAGDLSRVLAGLPPEEIKGLFDGAAKK